MKPSYPPRLRRQPRTGIVYVAIYTPRGRQWVSMGVTSMADARSLCTESMIGEMQMLASQNALVGEVVSRLLTGRRYTFEAILAGWKEAAACSVAPDTLNAYHITLLQCFRELGCEKQSLTEIGRITLYHWINQSGISLSTRAGRLASVRSFYDYAAHSGYCVGNVAMLIRVQTRDLYLGDVEPKATRPISEAEYRLLMDSPRVAGFWRYATALGYWLGYRLRDVAALQRSSIGDDSIRIFVGKTQRLLRLDLNEPLLGGAELKAILAEMVALPENDSPYFFPDRQKMAANPKTRAGLSVTYQRVLVRHGITGKRFHSLRYAMAVRHKLAGLSLEAIAERMGHRNTATTAGYTDHA